MGTFLADCEILDRLQSDGLVVWVLEILRRVMAGGPGELFGVFGCAFGDAGEDCLFGRLFFESLRFGTGR